MSDRDDIKNTFLESNGWGNSEISPIATDASFRHYERLRKNGKSTVLMDAPPDHEDVRPFQAISRLLNEWEFSAPKILAAEKSNGFLLLEDFGENGFCGTLQASPDLETGLYECAVDVLIKLHKRKPPDQIQIDDAETLTIPAYARELLTDELSLLTGWYFRALGRCGLERAKMELFALFGPLLDLIMEAEPVLVLRDYHAENIICLDDRPGLGRIGLLDFQDAVRGHPAYDLVSLLQDARRDVSPELEQAMIKRYLSARNLGASNKDEKDFLLAYHILGAQRNCKILGIFARLCLRDGKPGYLNLIPRVWGLLERNLDYPELAPIKDWFKKVLPAPQRKIPETSPKHIPAYAMILAAGLGLRMKPLTDDRPKPMIEVLGKPMIESSLAQLKKAGVRYCVINLHHKAQVMEQHLSSWNGRPRLTFSDERERLLDTGGGILNALPKLGCRPFYVLNGDAVWKDQGKSVLETLAMSWDEDQMDSLMLMVPLEDAHGYGGAGDYFMSDSGQLARRKNELRAPYIYGGIQMVHPRLFDRVEKEQFSMNILFDKSQRAGRLYGHILKGLWVHVGTPESIKVAEDLLRK